ncbi:MAG: DUF3991 domain-containing protein [Lachnospiraceae bacterium]
MYSTIIFNRTSWYRYSRGAGGSTIDFLMYFKNLEYKEAVAYLLHYTGYVKTELRELPGHPNKSIEKTKEMPKEKQEKAKKPFVLPERVENGKRLFGYLMKKRKLSKEVIQLWLKKGLLYESAIYHNLVFLGRDGKGAVRFASQRGTATFGKPFKGDVEGSDKSYGVNLIYPESRELNLYEAAIDAMSDMDYREDYKTNILALGMLWDGPLEKLLEQEKHIRSIHICLDNDLPGRAAAKSIARKYIRSGYEVSVRLPPLGKDYNVFLQYERENGELWNHLNQLSRKRADRTFEDWDRNTQNAIINSLCGEGKKPKQDNKTGAAMRR